MSFTIQLWEVGAAFLALAIWLFLTSIEDGGGYIPGVKWGRILLAVCSLLIAVVCFTVYFTTLALT